MCQLAIRWCLLSQVLFCAFCLAARCVAAGAIRFDETANAAGTYLPQVNPRATILVAAKIAEYKRS